MPRFVANNDNIRAIGATNRHKDGTFHLNDYQAKRGVKADAGFIVPDMSTATSPAEGFRCVDCGFGSWFRKCSKCGGECFRETEA